MSWNISKVIVTGETDLVESGLNRVLTERMVKLYVVDIMNNQQERIRMEKDLSEMERGSGTQDMCLNVLYGEFDDIQFLNHILKQ